MRWFRYEPAVPCRKHVYGEGIFVGQWQAQMRKPMEYGDGEANEQFAAIVSPFDPIAPDAIAASSFICWLGTNIGRCFLTNARRFHQENKLSLEQSYALAWAMEDVRMPGWNHHRRTLQAILPEEHITVRAVEIIGMTVKWLGTPAGQEMIDLAQAEIEETQRQTRERNAMIARTAQRVEELRAEFGGM
jgi:hypothetical protein